MIANAGYVPLSSLRERMQYELEDEARRYLKETSSTILVLAVNRPEDVARNWFFDFCADSLFLTNGIDDPVRIDPALVRYTHYHVDLSASSFATDAEGPIKVPPWLASKFRFCDPLTDNLIETFNDTVAELLQTTESDHSAELNKLCEEIFDKALCLHGYTRPLLFVEDASMRISFELYDYLAKQDDIDLAHYTSDDVYDIEAILRGFDGYFLATTDQVFEMDWQRYCMTIADKEIQDHLRDSGTAFDGSGRGRPRKQELAYKAFQKLFPNGRAGTSWTEVENAISKQLGDRVSAQTIRMALKNSLKTEK